MYQGWDIAQQQWRSIPIDAPGARADMFSILADRDVEAYSQGPDLRYEQPIYQWWYHTHRTALRMAVKELDSNPSDLLKELILNCIARAEHCDYRLWRDLPVHHMVIQAYCTLLPAPELCRELAEMGRFDIIQYLEQHGMPVSFDIYHNEGQMLKRLPSYYPELPERYIPDNDYGTMATIRSGRVESDDMGWNESMILPVRVAADAIRRGLLSTYHVGVALPSHSYAHDIYKAPLADKQLVLAHLSADSHPEYRYALERPTDDKNFYQWYQGLTVLIVPRFERYDDHGEEIPMFATDNLIFVDPAGLWVVTNIDDKALPLHYLAKDHPEDILTAMALLGNHPQFQHTLHSVIKYLPTERQAAVLAKLYQ